MGVRWGEINCCMEATLLIKRRNIPGETFSREVKPPEIKKVDHIEGVNHNQPKRPMKKVLRWITKTVAGENKAGEAIHGILDLLPIPNQVIAKAASYLTKGNTREARKELNKLLTVRNGIAVLAFLLVVTGILTVDDVRKLLEAIGDFL